MHKIFNEIRKITLFEWIAVLVAAVFLIVVLLNIHALSLNRNTQLVRREMKQIGYVEEAKHTTLEQTAQSGIYRASIVVYDAEGRAIEYWKINYNYNPWTPWSLWNRDTATPYYGFADNLEEAP